MNYKEYLDQQFEKYKKTKKVLAVYDKILLKSKHRFMVLLRDHGNSEANRILIGELKTIKQNYPMLNSAPRINKNDIKVEYRGGILLTFLVIALIVILYIYVPILAIIPQLAIALFAYRYVTTVYDEHQRGTKIHNYNKYHLPLFYFFLFFLQTAMMIIFIPVEETPVQIILFGHGVIYFFAAVTFYIMTLGDSRKIEHKVWYRILSFSIFDLKDTYIFTTYILFSLMIFVMHYFYVFIDELFSL